MVTQQINRYGIATPTSFTQSGLAISCPIYITLTTEQSKALLNGFREVKRQQLQDIGYQDTRTSDGLKVVTRGDVPQTAIERECGFTEDALRQIIFGRQGISERTVLTLQRLTGVQVVSKDEIKQAQELWLDNVYVDDKKKVKRTRKASKTAASASVE